MTERVAYSRADINGGASPSRLASGINASAVSFAIGSGEQASWPTGSDGKFLVCFDRGQANEEKAWVASRSGVNCSIDDVGDRGADDTSAAAHDADATVEVVIGAVHIDEANKAVAELLGKGTTAGMVPYFSAAQTITMRTIGASGRIWISDGSVPQWVAVSGDITIASNGAVTIGASKITNTMMADDAVDSAEIADGAIDTVHIGDLQVTTGKLAADAVTGAKLADDSVDSEHYVDGSIDTAHIGASQITNALMADDAVDSAEIADGAVDLVHMSANSVDSAQYVDGSIDPEHLADDAVTLAKLAAAAKPRWMVDGWNNGGAPLSGSATSLIRPAGSSIATIVIPEACAIVGLSVSVGSARTAGTLTVEVTKNGSATGFTAVIDGTNTLRAYSTQAETEDTLAAGDRIGVRFTTSTFTPTTNDIEAAVLLQAV